MLIFRPNFCLLSLIALILASAGLAQEDPSAKRQSPAATIEQAESLLNAGNVEAALKILTAIPRSESNSAQILHLLGSAFYQKADYAHAIENLSLAVNQ